MAKHSLTPATWIEAGLEQLAAEGPQALRAEPLARHLKTTKGSFYWHFKDVPAFHDAVLAHWKDGALGAAAALKDAEGSEAERLIQLGQAVQSDSADAALRAWGQSNPLVAQIVAGDVAHLHQESKVPALRGRSGAGSLKYFDDADRGLVNFQGAGDQQIFGGISRHVFGIGTGVRPDQSGFALVGDPF